MKRWKDNADLLNVVMIGVTNDLPEHDEKYELHRLIGALLSDRLRENEKLDIIEKEYKIPVNDNLRKQFGNMSRGILKRFLDKRVTLTNLCTP